jgi:hypothetical protein
MIKTTINNKAATRTNTGESITLSVAANGGFGFSSPPHHFASSSLENVEIRVGTPAKSWRPPAIFSGIAMATHEKNLLNYSAAAAAAAVVIEVVVTRVAMPSPGRQKCLWERQEEKKKVNPKFHLQ